MVVAVHPETTPADVAAGKVVNTAFATAVAEDETDDTIQSNTQSATVLFSAAPAPAPAPATPVVPVTG